MNQEHLIKLLQIINTDSIGPITFFKLLNKYKTIENILDILPSITQKQIANEKFAIKEIETCEKENIKIITYEDKEYPKELEKIQSKPIIIYAKGNAELLNKISVAIVGSRNASINAKKFTEIISRSISDKGYPIISGLAIGIDTSAHKGAIKDKIANTIAVLGGGIKDIYPRQNTNLYNEIIDKGGLIISEKPTNYKAKAQDFPIRNRIISGISSAVILTEATEKSGSLITIKNAISQNKLIYGIPNHPSDPRSYGPNKIIANGAKIFTTTEEFIKELNRITASKEENKSKIDINNIIQKRQISSIERKAKQINKIKEIEKYKTRTERVNLIKEHILISVSSNGNTITELLEDLQRISETITYSELTEAILYLELEDKIINAEKIYKI